MSRSAPVLAALISALAWGCDSRTGAPTPLPAEYRTLAARLTEELKPNQADFRDDKSLAETLAEGHHAVLDLRAIRSADAEINYAAEQGEAAYAAAVARLERVIALPRPPSVESLVVESFAHGLIGDVFGGIALGVDADDKQRALLAELDGLVAAVEKGDAAHLLLPRVAERYAAPSGAGAGRISVDFDEAWNAWVPHDWCGLHNGGGDLSDCTVVVDLEGAGGRSRRNVHFLKHWPGNSWVYARYAPGHQIGERRVGRTTVDGVAAVKVRVLSPGYSGEARYTYAGAERDKDVRRRIAEVRPHVHCRVRNSIWGSGAGKVLVLESRLKHPLFDVRVRAVSANGAPVGEFVKRQFDAGDSMDVGSLQVSRNLRSGDRVTVWLGEGELLTTTVP